MAMANINKIWIETYHDAPMAIRLDWDNDRHHRVETDGSSKGMIRALHELTELVAYEESKELI